MSKFKAVLFDLGGTLIKTVDVPEIYRKILEAYGVKASYEDIAEAHKENEKEFDVQNLIKLKQDFWVKWNARVLVRIGINKNRELLARKIDELWWDYADSGIYSDAMEALSQLKNKGIKIGVVTNALEKDYQQILQKLDLIDLNDYLDVFVGIDACNKAKPDKAIFVYAVNKLCVHPEEAIFVGDSVKYDYEGAKNAGLKPLLISREGKAPTGVETIRSLTELLHYV
jgi:putative hydrolase of the HAD superfamily